MNDFGTIPRISAAVQHGGAVEDLIVHNQGQADDGQSGENADLGNAAQLGDSGTLEGFLMEQIATGVARERQLGKDENGNSFSFGSFQEAEDAFGIERTIGDSQRRDGSGDAEETVVHYVSK